MVCVGIILTRRPVSNGTRGAVVRNGSLAARIPRKRAISFALGDNLGTPRRIRCNASQAFAVGLLLVSGAGNGALAEPPAGTEAGASGESSASDEPKTLPQENFFSSVKQSLRLGFDHEVVRGHFDFGTAPNSHRYYCLVDTKTRSREPNGVLGQPVALPDGTTGLKIDAVSLYSCDKAEKQGMLVTSGYLLKAPNGGTVASQPQPQPQSQPQPQPQPQPLSQASPPPLPAPLPPQAASQPVALPAMQTPSPPSVSPDKIDVAGVKLGMSPDEVRAVLKSKRLREYNEATETLGYLDSARGAMQSIANGRFVNAIAAWNPPTVGDGVAVDGESYEVMFTPVPGKERAMAIVHSVGYSPANAIHEVALEDGLVKKYGGFTGSNNLPESPTWLFQSGGNVKVGDACSRRGLFGGLGGLNAAKPARENLALKKSPEEFGYQIDRCGVAIVTEDHVTANGGALREDRLVTRFTVTAYSPAIAMDGAKSATQLIQSAKGALNKADAARAKDQSAPNL
jgi:hypothetical protein